MRGCRPLTTVEIPQAYKHLRGLHRLRNHTLYTLALKSGLRITCLLSLRIHDVYDGDIVKHIDVRKSTVKGKRAGFQHPMHPKAATMLKQYIELHCQGLPGSAPLFRSGKHDADGRPQPLERKSAWRILTRASRSAGLRGKVGCHSTRKTYAKRVYQLLGHDLISIQAAMHHASITSITQHLSFQEEKVEKTILAI